MNGATQLACLDLLGDGEKLRLERYHLAVVRHDCVVARVRAAAAHAALRCVERRDKILHIPRHQRRVHLRLIAPPAIHAPLRHLVQVRPLAVLQHRCKHAPPNAVVAAPQMHPRLHLHLLNLRKARRRALLEVCPLDALRRAVGEGAERCARRWRRRRGRCRGGCCGCWRRRRRLWRAWAQARSDGAHFLAGAEQLNGV